MAKKSKKIIIGGILLGGGCLVLLFIVLVALAGGGVFVYFQTGAEKEALQAIEEQYALEEEMAVKAEEEARRDAEVRAAEEEAAEAERIAAVFDELANGPGVVKPSTAPAGVGEVAVKEPVKEPVKDDPPPPKDDPPASAKSVTIKHSAPNMLVVGDTFAITATTPGSSACDVKMVWRSESRSWTTVRLRKSGERHTGSLTLQSDHAPELEYYIVAGGSCDGRSPSGGGLHKARVF